MLRAVADSREHYETIRGVSIPIDTEPAFTFRPPLPRGPNAARGSAARRSPRASRASSGSLPTLSGSLEELAFLPVAALASLVESRKVSSIDLTRMYLTRLKRYDQTLKAVITLTEELALAQASEADREIRRGRYRGPLHGIP
ncbi:MAG: amidase, partial [Acidobacteria bacterium]|nr:amidase [Acidobacteriota bacterium]